ncbi:alpha-like surface protein [Streptococcus anginosus]|nr:alpha-like surface protein [Streptococcus anginosus]WEB50916.1 alpha-like surface protein [Streptococcus anginosus]
MLRKYDQRNYDVAQTKQRFSIKKFKVGVASVLIGLSFLGGVVQGQLNTSVSTVFAAEVIPGSAATLNTKMTKNIKNGRAYIDLYDVKNGKIDPLQLITLNPPTLTAQYVIRQGGRYFTQPSELTNIGQATINYTIFEADGSNHLKPDGQVDIVSVSLTIYNSSELRAKIDEVEKNAKDPKWDEESRNKVLTGLDDIKTDIDINPKTQADIDNKITEVSDLEKTLVTPTPDADKNEPKAKDQTVKVGETPKAEDSIGNIPELPKGTKFEYETPVDTTTPGDKDAKVIVTYPDGSTDTVDVKVKVIDPRTDADKNEPKAKDQTVKVGETPKAEDSIGNIPELPKGTKFEYETPVDTTTPGDKDAKVIVTYPDGSTDTVDVKVKVIDPRTDADKNEPKAKDQTVKVGETPKAEDSIGNIPELPKGTKFEYETPVDTTTPGDKDAKVIVTYPDGSTDTVDVKVKVIDPRTDADKNEPKAKDQTENQSNTNSGTKALPNTGETNSPFFTAAAMAVIVSTGVLYGLVHNKKSEETE